MDNWRVRRYPNTGIAEALQAVFGDAELRDAMTDVLITSYDIEHRRPGSSVARVRGRGNAAIS
jgi:patatin-like phospholipase/acyl hydrolase